LRFRVPWPLEKVLPILSPDGKKLLLATDDELMVMDTTTGKELRHSELGEHRHLIPAITGIPSSHAAVALSDDAQLLAVLEEAGELYLYDPATGKQLRHFPTAVKGPASRVIFSADHTKVVATNGSFKESPFADIHDTPSGRKVAAISPLQEEYSAAVSADGMFVATWTESSARRHVVQVWDAITGKERRRITVEGPGVRSLVFSPDGTKFALAQGREAVSLYEVATGKRLHHWDADRGTSDLHFDPDGQFLAAVGENDRILLWNLATCQRTTSGCVPQGRVESYRVLPGGKVLACVGFETGFSMWDALPGIVQPTFHGHPAPVTALVFHPDGRTLLSAGRDSIRRWDLRTGKGVKLTPTRRWPDRLNQDYWTCLAADGRHVLTTFPHRWGIRLFNFETEVEVLSSLTSTFYELDTAVVSSNGRVFAALEEVSGERGKKVVLRVFDLLSGEEKRKFAVITRASGNLGVFASPDGVKVGAIDGKGTTGSPLQAQVWDVASGKEAKALPTVGAEELALSPGGRLLAVTADDEIMQLQDLESGQEWPALEKTGEGLLFAPTFSPDSRFLAAAWSSPDWERSRIVVWELASSQIRMEFSGHCGSINALAFSRDSRTLASGGRDTTVLLWDLLGDTGEEPAPGTKDLDELWRDLNGNARVAHRALARLVKVPVESVALVRKRLPVAPGHPPEPRRIARWIADLNAGDFETRQQATQALQEAGQSAESAMQAALKETRSPEQKRRLEFLLKRLGRAGVAADMLRPVRALELVERIGTPEARHLVEELARGNPNADLTLHAKEVLRRFPSR
jgi:WD40 repeat protein